MAAQTAGAAAAAASTAKLVPLPTLTVEKHQLSARGRVPNTSLHRRPLLIYRGAFAPAAAVTPDLLEAHLRGVGAVTPRWRYTMYSRSHFHSSAHEVLGIAAGRAVLCFGGAGDVDVDDDDDDDGHDDDDDDDDAAAARNGLVVECARGDVIVVPAGVAHRLLEDRGAPREPFLMVGAYPPGCDWDMCYGLPGEDGVADRIRALPWFGLDPLYGARGPALDVE